MRTRLVTAREGARLMGLPDVVGDGVAVPLVRWLAAHLLEPLIGANSLGVAAE